ncbi:MAG: Cyclohexanone monooxygenase [uncultured Solirubrobacterales bacterium]|uniref:Cyclohexanone monooxygenase n=1 Tax=uncultured Solirubrobacterales bacterium TaxID=768556 RepID=A0A6J4RQ52_9ACTN|nr:MAG: Cyclohexanone monooxygenase [uncultured Solirubrobacterales bacterium]
MTQLEAPAAPTEADPLPDHARIAIVGAGFSGLALGMGLLEEGIDDFVVLERAHDVGGTWRDNTYPGCACDVPSHLYSFSFAPNPDWTRTYSQQPEIYEYIRRTAAERGVDSYVRFGHEVQGSRWNEDAQQWHIETSGGELTANYLVSAMGPLSAPAWPKVEGLDCFEGKIFHSAEWDHEHDLSGERVGVIGTGASAIQFVPAIQPQVGRLHVFQRTPPWILPRPDRATTRLERHAYRRFPWLQKLTRTLVYWRQELLMVPGLVYRPQIMKAAEAASRWHLRRHVRDEKLREELTPDYRLGCKRILISDEWYPALAADNVEVVHSGIEEVRARSIVTADGTEREVDTIILGTGFRATDMVGSEHIHGRDGRSLHETWQGSPQAHLGTTVAGFPNLFLLVGPNLGPGHTSVVFYTESQVRYLLDTLKALERREATSFEVRKDVQDAYNADLQERMRKTVWTTGGCNSWYLDETGKNTTLWPGFSWELRLRTRSFDPTEHELRRNGQRAATGASTAAA